MCRSAWNRLRTRLGSLLILLYCFAAPLQADPPANVTFTYDDLARLRTGVYNDGRRVDYQYDAAGNRTTMASGMTPTLTIGNATANVTEGSALLFPVTFTGTTAQNVTVSCVPQNGTAQGGGAAPFDDFVTTAQQVTFLPSDPSGTVKNCSITTKTDSYYEGTQSLTAVLQNATAGTIISPPGSASGSILDANAGPVFSVAGSSIAEGSAVTFTITKTGLTELSHNVSYATANGTATTADSDYTAIGATAVTFTSGQTSAPVSVTTTNDTKYESNETVALNLSTATSGATIGTSSANGTINNNDAAPTIAIVDSAAANEGALVTLTIQNVGNTNTAFTHSISWATANNTATAGTDYTANSGTVSFASGETAKTVQVQSLTDGVYEGSTSENFFVNITTNASSNGAAISDSQGIGTIAEMDNVAPGIPGWTSPNRRDDPDGAYTVDWTDVTGPLHHYVLDEEHNGGGAWVTFTSYTVTGASFKSFTGKVNGEWRYRVKSCNSGNTCSSYSTTILVNVCSGPCQ
jgi:hypothetical protein